MSSSSTSTRGGGSDQPPQPQRRLMRTQTAGNLGETIFDSEVVPSSPVEIAPILRVAKSQSGISLAKMHSDIPRGEEQLMMSKAVEALRRPVLELVVGQVSS
ncbi:Callose synthase 3 [Morella rubra]|uniref:Callose synthase 3 n=1 Tax=Morella rubra TaxID=262757 RepID=A0A6A1WRG1_9ROSI|nr:Callose synthase 3 [Morella rubra]